MYPMPMTPQKGYHCAYDAHYHIVFPVKYSKALLFDDIMKTTKEDLWVENFGLVVTMSQ